ncbi:MAG: hypothetical protein AAB495_03950 [Patescibacteria group bacterium]
MTNKKSHAIQEIFAAIIPFVGFFLIEIWVRNEWGITLGVVALLLVSMLYRREKNEWLLFLAGAALGFFVEVVLGLVYREQFWVNGSLWGVPVWLPIVWGGGFVFIRRLGNLIVRRA